MTHSNICINTATVFSMRSNKIGMATGSGLRLNSCEKMSWKKTTRPYRVTWKNKKGKSRLWNTKRASSKEIRVRYPFWTPILPESLTKKVPGTALVCRKPETSQASKIATSRWLQRTFSNQVNFLVGRKNTYQVRGIRVKENTGTL